MNPPCMKIRPLILECRAYCLLNLGQLLVVCACKLGRITVVKSAVFLERVKQVFMRTSQRAQELYDSSLDRADDAGSYADKSRASRCKLTELHLHPLHCLLVIILHGEARRTSEDGPHRDCAPYEIELALWD